MCFEASFTSKISLTIDTQHYYYFTWRKGKTFLFFQQHLQNKIFVALMTEYCKLN